MRRTLRADCLKALVVGIAAIRADNVAATGPLDSARDNQDRPVTFARDVAPIIFDRCGTCHHPDGAAPFSLLTYAAARQRATLIAAVAKSRFMPPWKSEPGYGEFIGHQPLSDAEIGVMQQWVADGAPEGDPRDLPPPPQWTEGWQLGKPDLVVTLPQPYVLRADGTDISRVFVLPVPVRTMRYVKGLEFRPGNPKVVHHANIRIDRTPASRELDDQDPAPGYDGLLSHSAVYPDGHFLGWTPGQVAPLLPKGLAWSISPGTDLVVEVHMKPTGRAEVVEPSIGLYFGDDPPERTPAMLRLGRQSIDIAAGEKDYAVTDSFVLPVDVEVQAVQPHAHYRAREVRGMATLPDGATKWLIYIKDWDFRWQHVYRYVTPFALPKGTTLSMRYTYDNSAENPRNPQQPPRRVRWGQWTKDEMGDLWIQVLTRDDRDLQILNDTYRPKMIAEDIVGYETMIQGEPSRVQLHDDVAALYLDLGREQESAAHFEASVRLKPESSAAHYNFATALTLAGRMDEAIGQYQQALRIRPDYAIAHNNLGSVLLRLGNPGEALQHFREALRLDPANAEAHYNVGSVFGSRGNFSEAIGSFREAVRLKPDWIPAVTSLAWLLATAPDAALHDANQAVRLAERAVALSGRKDARALDVLAAAYAAAGEFDRAVAAAQAALGLKPADPDAAAIRRRQELYRQRKPYVSPPDRR
ncbi:MAG: tetratricopeptide repeat protein [Acidobacteria bacterium]|nr:tetratricopeptide repeat protein [Acidobacteriota bacterium]